MYRTHGSTILRSVSLVEMFMAIFTWYMLKPSRACFQSTQILLLSVKIYNFKTESAIILLGYSGLFMMQKMLWVITNVPEESAV
jgi:hypothetical protein